MSKLILIAGPNDSGKSLFAEQLIAGMPQKRVYLATMRPCTEENHRRIAKHRKQREALNFRTMELPLSVGDAPVSPDEVVLLEDVSNLLANVWFEQKGTAEAVYSDLLRLWKRCAVLVAVTIAGLDPEEESSIGVGYDEETKAYIRALNELNARLEELAEVSISMQKGTAVWKKGELHAYT